MNIIDLGLPSGTLWTDCNVGANTPEDYGSYFRWGETEEIDDYVLLKYKYQDIGKNIAGTKYDAATALLGKEYRMPTIGQIKELVRVCSFNSTTKGIKITGPNNNHIFIPHSGYRHFSNGSLHNVDDDGYCWSASASDNNLNDAHSLYFNSSYWYWSNNIRAAGFTIRAIYKP